MTPLRAVLLGALTVGVLDILDAIVFFGLRGVAPIRIFQGIAAGLLGRASFQGGAATALLGAFLHFFIAFSVVLVYYLASTRVVVLRRRPWICGPAYGLAVYGVMYVIVLPLSAALPPRHSFLHVANLLFAHLFLVGLPSALFARAAGEANARAAGEVRAAAEETKESR